MTDLLNKSITSRTGPVAGELCTGRNTQATKAILSGAQIAAKQLAALVTVPASLAMRKLDLRENTFFRMSVRRARKGAT